MNELFLRCLKVNLDDGIAKITKESPSLHYKCKCLKQIKSHISYITVFKVCSSTAKGKLKSLLKPEEKIKIKKDKLRASGVIVEVVEDEVVVEMHTQLSCGEYEIERATAYNNKIVLDRLLSFISSQKKIPTELVAAWTERLEQIVKKNIGNGDKELTDMCKELHDVKKNIATNESVDYIPTDKFCRNINKVFDTYCNDIPCVVNVTQAIQSFCFQDLSLNTPQKLAVSEIVNNHSYKIFGPPGTGKTRTIVEILCYLINNKNTVLVCGPSNVAIDNLIERTVNNEYFCKHKIRFYRLGSSQKGFVQYNLKKIVDRETSFYEPDKGTNKCKRDLYRLQDTYKKNIQAEAKLVFGTLFSSLSEYRYFDWIIIDEACQGSDAEIFLNLVKAKHYILVGDPNQLCYHKTTLFEKLHIKSCLLSTQYRMCSNLIEFSNVSFYNSSILSHSTVSFNLVNNSPICLIDTEGYDYYETESEKSKLNTGEADIIIRLLQNTTNSSIGVITPYSAQKIYLKERVNAEIEILTVDGFQGREKDFIILSLVRSNDNHEFGFLDDFRRLNVAITRCRKGLIIVANTSTFRKSHILNSYFKYLMTNFAVLDPEDISLCHIP